MKKSTKVSLALTPALSLVMIALLWLFLLKPWVLNFAQSQIPQINQRQNLFEVQLSKIDFSLLKLQAYAYDLQIRLNTDPTNTITIPEIRLQVDPFDLLIGQIQASYLILDQSQINLNEAIFNLSPKSDNQEVNLNPLFQLLPKIPLKKLILSNATVRLNQTKEKMQFKSKIDILSISNLKKSLTLQLSSSEHEVITDHLSQITGAAVTLSGQVELFPEQLNIKQITAKIEKSSLNLSGSLNQLKNVFIEPSYTLKTKGEFIFENLKPFYYFFDRSQKRLPQILGTLQFAGEVSGQGFKQNKGRFSVQTNNLKVDYISIGNADLQVNLKNNFFVFDQISLNHPSGEIRLNQVELTQQKPFKFKTKIQLNQFNLQKLFSSLELKNIPASFDSSATALCSGELMPLNASCDVDSTIQDLWVKSSLENKNYIVQIKKASIRGQVKINDKAVNYSSQIKMNTSLIESQGSVDYEKGFDLKFKSLNFNLEDIQNLAGLNLKGFISGELKTTGTSQKGIIDSQIITKNFEIDRFKLGQINGLMKYAEGQLKLENLNGEIDQSLYLGNVEFDFKQGSLSGSLTFPKLYGQSLITVLDERFNLPFQLTGQGSGQMDFSGPFDFWKLKYQLKATLQRGSLLDETFNLLQAHLSANGEKIDFEKVSLVKPSGQLAVTGSINTSFIDPEFNLNFETKNLRAEEVDRFRSLLPKSTGQINSAGQITGKIGTPLIQGQIALRDFTIEGLSLLSSQGEFNLNKNFFNFNGQIFGRQAQTFIQWPFQPAYDFIFKAQLRDLNPLTFLPLIRIPPVNAETSSLLTAEIDLRAPYAKLHDMKGQVQLQSFALQKNNQTLKLQKPSSLVFNSGLKSLTPIVIKGQNQNLEIQQNAQILNFKGLIQLKTLDFLAPFLENINGELNFDFGLNLQSKKLLLAGDGQLKDGQVQIKGFPYPLKNINADIDFSQSKIILSSLQTTLNESQITGFGNINFVAAQNIDVNIQAESTRLDLEFPSQIQTSGIAKIKFLGQWLPYTLKIDYQIDAGLVSKEFTGEQGDTKLTLPPSPYLPPQQLSLQRPSLLLDVNTKFPKGLIIKNSILEGIAKGELRITGSPDAPVISGRIDLESNSKLLFKDKPFDIQTGFVIFNPNNTKSSEINPEIFMNASSRVSDYDINLLISGQAKNLSIKPTSQPPLSENDIFSLLALGFTASTQDQNLTSNTQQKQTGLEVIAAISNQSKFNKQIQEKLGLNVQITPSVDSTKNIAVPKVVVSRKLGKKINASYARPLTGDQQSNEVKVQWLFHPDFSLNLNYQNQTDEAETSIIQNNENDKGNYGIDVEYKKEFK